MIHPGVFKDAEGNYRDPWGNAVAVFEEEVDLEPQDPTQGIKDYSGLTIEELKADLRGRQELGRQFDTSKIKKKADLIQALIDDDEATAQQDKE